jgi:hypothetical protein
MPLTLIYTKQNTTEQSYLYLPVVTKASFPKTMEISEHPTETKSSFTDNAVRNLDTVPVSLVIPAYMPKDFNINSINLYDLDSATAPTPDARSLMKIGTSDNQNTAIINESDQIISKEDILAELEYICNNAIICSAIFADKTYDKMLISSLPRDLVIENGDAYFLEMELKEVMIVSSQKVKAPKSLIKKLTKSSKTVARSKKQLDSKNLNSDVGTYGWMVSKVKKYRAMDTSTEKGFMESRALNAEIEKNCPGAYKGDRWKKLNTNTLPTGTDVFKKNPKTGLIDYSVFYNN